MSVPSYQSISKLVQYPKGKTSRKFQQKFPELKGKYWGKHSWMKNYIDRHGPKEEKHGDFKLCTCCEEWFTLE